MLPCRRDKCMGPACGNFNDPASKWGNPKLPRGCKGGEFPPWEWCRWFLDDLPKLAEAIKRKATDNLS